MTRLRVAVIGAGWAGLAVIAAGPCAAVEATRLGHGHVFETARIAGGRARRVDGTLPDGTSRSTTASTS
jgi:predicted NAD/FAD-binding protein